jgi:hypothetical protein
MTPQTKKQRPSFPWVPGAGPKKKLPAPGRAAKGNLSALPYREREGVENEHDPDKTANTPT